MGQSGTVARSKASVSAPSSTAAVWPTTRHREGSGEGGPAKSATRRWTNSRQWRSADGGRSFRVGELPRPRSVHRGHLTPTLQSAHPALERCVRQNASPADAPEHAATDRAVCAPKCRDPRPWPQCEARHRAQSLKARSFRAFDTFAPKSSHLPSPAGDRERDGAAGPAGDWGQRAAGSAPGGVSARQAPTNHPPAEPLRAPTG